MKDPTFLVLCSAFGAGLAVFWFAAAWKILMTKASGAMPDGRPTPPPLPPGGRVQVWFYRPLDLFGAMLVLAVFSVIVLAAAAAVDARQPDLNAGALVVNIGFQFMMAGLVAFTLVGRRNPVDWLGLRWPTWQWVFLLAPGAVVFMWLVAAGLYFSDYSQWMKSLGVQTTQDTVKLLRETNDPLVLGLMAFAAVVAAPVCEEIVFRGYLYPILKKYAGIGAATFSSSILFAAAHGHLAAIVPLSIFSVLLVLLYEKTGSLWAPIAAHFCFNAATVGATFAARYYEIPIGLIP